MRVCEVVEEGGFGGWGCVGELEDGGGEGVDWEPGAELGVGSVCMIKEIVREWVRY